MNITELKNMLLSNSLDTNLSLLYSHSPETVSRQKDRYLKLVELYEEIFSSTENAGLFSAPGRTELGGNHTDHQHGQVIAAAVNLDMIACCCPNESNIIRIKSEGFDMLQIDTDELSPRSEEVNTSSALVRGIYARIASMGYRIGGFDACITSDVLTGSGLSSSAAFEVLIGVIINHLFCKGEISPAEIAKIGQYAENIYFGKPSGLMDQMASSVGNVVEIDFKDIISPIVSQIDFDFDSSGHALCIIDSGADHADLTDEYASIPCEMKKIATFFSRDFLREVSEDEFYSNIIKLRKYAGDRAVLRASHFFADTRRASEQSLALRRNDWEGFLEISRESGHSSFEYLQNVYVPSSPEIQDVSIALAVCQHLLGKRGSFRVHGGGFAGTIQAFVPADMLEHFSSSIEAFLGSGCCHILSIRPFGGVNVLDIKK